ncbi:response regulator transcription factor [Streptomyces sp. NPDC055239]
MAEIAVSACAQLVALAPRELQVLRLIAEGFPARKSPGRPHVTEETVKTHASRVLTTLGLRDRTQAVVVAYESGLVVPGATGDITSLRLRPPSPSIRELTQSKAPTAERI